MDILDFQYRYLVQIAMFIAVAIWAFHRGAQPERACAAVFVGMIVLDRSYHALITRSYEVYAVDFWTFALDLTVLALLIPISLRANRIYPMALAALQLIAVNAHIARDAFTQITPFAYVVMYIVPSYGQLMVLTCGVWAHVRRAERSGPYRDWRRSAHPA